MTLPDGRKVIAFDFDGVLHKYHGWNEGKLAGPIPGMVYLVDCLRAEGAYCVVHTTRDGTNALVHAARHRANAGLVVVPVKTDMERIAELEEQVRELAHRLQQLEDCLDEAAGGRRE